MVAFLRNLSPYLVFGFEFVSRYTHFLFGNIFYFGKGFDIFFLALLLELRRLEHFLSDTIAWT